MCYYLFNIILYHFKIKDVAILVDERRINVRREVDINMIGLIQSLMSGRLPDAHFYMPKSEESLHICPSKDCLCMNGLAIWTYLMNTRPDFKKIEDNQERHLCFEAYLYLHFHEATFRDLLKYGFCYKTAGCKLMCYASVDTGLCEQYIASILPAPEKPDINAYPDFHSLRVSYHMSQKQFAQYLDVPYRTYNKWESGERTAPPYIFTWAKSYCLQNPPEQSA